MTDNKHMHKGIVFVDIETTDTDIEKATVIELAGVLYSSTGVFVRNFTVQVLPQTPVSKEAATVNGYTEEQNRNAVPFDTAIDSFKTTLLKPYGTNFVFASYFTFDFDILIRQCKENKLDTTFLTSIPRINIADLVYPAVISGFLPSRKLSDLADWLGFSHTNAHKALYDATMLARCYFEFMRKFRRNYQAASMIERAVDELKDFIPLVTGG